MFTKFNQRLSFKGPRSFLDRNEYLEYAVHFILFFFVLFAASLNVAFAQTRHTHKNPETYSTICDDVALDAARIKNIPAEIMLAITRTETARSVNGTNKPWPWTINIDGRGFWFDTRGEALSFVFDHFLKGARSFDLGCFQINYRWHGANFSSIEEMLDPVANANYAASFLSELYRETGTWQKAVGAFHSRNAVFADRYMVRFASMLDEVQISENSAFHKSSNQFSSDISSIRQNEFPLLRSGISKGSGSLVPLSDTGSRRPFVDFSTRSGG